MVSVAYSSPSLSLFKVTLQNVHITPRSRPAQKWFPGCIWCGVAWCAGLCGSTVMALACGRGLSSCWDVRGGEEGVGFVVTVLASCVLLASGSSLLLVLRVRAELPVCLPQCPLRTLSSRPSLCICVRRGLAWAAGVCRTGAGGRGSLSVRFAFCPSASGWWGLPGDPCTHFPVAATLFPRSLAGLVRGRVALPSPRVGAL